MLLSLLALMAPSALAQYQIRYIYSDYTCSTLVAVKSVSLDDWDNKDDDKEEENQWQDGSLDEATQKYNKCLEELEEEEVNEYGYANCKLVEQQEQKEGGGHEQEQQGHGTFAGVVTYEKLGCSYDIETVGSVNKVMVAEYEEGCPQDGGAPSQYISMPQQCFPFAIPTNNDGQQQDQGEYYQAQQTYSYYAIQCDAENRMTTYQCRNSNCSDCVLTTTYIEDECYSVNINSGSKQGGGDDKDDKEEENKNGQQRMYAQYWCNTTFSYSETEDDVEDDTTAMMELPKSTVIAACSIGGALILGLGGALAFQSMSPEDGVKDEVSGNLQGGADYQRLAN